ncbi:flagellar hook-length control protein FliK [Shewanella waksmanii]|uniref:flagellar hook-length control protein FliK n=1 Tax=Shewanella waksmanii TaxID=213783 RepID=UPI00373589E4
MMISPAVTLDKLSETETQILDNQGEPSLERFVDLLMSPVASATPQLPQASFQGEQQLQSLNNTASLPYDMQHDPKLALQQPNALIKHDLSIDKGLYPQADIKAVYLNSQPVNDVKSLDISRAAMTNTNANTTDQLLTDKLATTQLSDSHRQPSSVPLVNTPINLAASRAPATTDLTAPSSQTATTSIAGQNLATTDEAHLLSTKGQQRLSGSMSGITPNLLNMAMPEQSSLSTRNEITSSALHTELTAAIAAKPSTATQVSQWGPVSIATAAPQLQQAQQLLTPLREQLRFQIDQQIKTAELRLDPPSLGKVELNIRLDGDRLHIQMHAANASVRDSLLMGLERLRTDLANDHGGQVNVDISQGDSHSKQQQTEQHAISSTAMLDDSATSEPSQDATSHQVDLLA